MRFTFDIGGESRQFDRLPVRSILDVSESIAARDRRQAGMDADSLSLSPADRMAAMERLIDRRDLFATLCRSCFTLHGARAVIEASCGTEADAVMEAVEPEGWTRLALMLVGAVDAAKAVEDAGKAAGSPTTG